jgi:site-specific recombinase XerD
MLPSLAPASLLPPALAEASPSAQQAILQFFAAEIRNRHTRRAYLKSAQLFFAYAAGLPGGCQLEAITSLHVASWLEHLAASGQSIATVKQRLAAIRMLFQALARERVVPFNPVAVVRGPRHSVRRGKTPVLTPEEARQLLDAIDTGTLAGLRDRALIATMVYSFARIGAVIALKVEDVYSQQRRLWLRLAEKGGKRTEVPCHHALEDILAAYIEAAGLGSDPKAPLFQSLQRDGSQAEGRRLSGKPLSQALTWCMLQRRARAAGLATAICNHTFRATGITAYLKGGGTIERAAVIAGHASTRTTSLYDRRPDDISLDEIEKIQI